MKKIIFSLFAASFFGLAATAQIDEKYTQAMEQKVVAVDTLRKSADLIELSAAFERIAEAEKNKWLPYYYAALTQVNAAYFMGMDNIQKEKTDPMADKAEALISKADVLSPKNSEIYLVKKNDRIPAVNGRSYEPLYGIWSKGGRSHANGHEIKS